MYLRSCHEYACFVFRAVLAPYFNEIYLMPESSALANVTAVLKKHLEGPRRYLSILHFGK